MEPEPLSARDEIRVSEFGLLRCPSCGQLAAEILMTSHCLLILPDSERLPADGSGGLLVVECRDGQRTVIRDYDSAVAAANISLADDVSFPREAALQVAVLPETGWPHGPAVRPGAAVNMDPGLSPRSRPLWITSSTA